MDDPHLKTTSKNMKSGISQQPLIESYSTFKPELRGQKQNGKVQESKTTFNYYYMLYFNHTETP